MFTGMITDLGRVRAVRREADLRLEIETAYETGGIAMGASVACSGVCLTVVEKGDGWLAFDASGETEARTTIGDWAEGTPVNLERPLRVGDELGGHIVSGHVDGVADIVEVAAVGGSRRVTVSIPKGLGKFICEKGSIALDGVSLTVNVVGADSFEVNIVPHTQEMTNFGTLEAGDRVNVEVDLLARYLARLAEAGGK